MSTAENLIIGAQNYATTHAANAGNSASLVFELVNKMMSRDEIELPNFNKTIISSAGPISVGTVPAFTANYAEPTGIPDAPDIADIVEDAYNNADPVTQAALTAAIDAWLTSYSPDYKASIRTLQGAVDSGITTGQALSDAIEQAIYNRAAQRILAETRANQKQASNAMRRRGYELPQVSLSSALNKVNAESADRLAISATETAIERHKLEIQHKQFCMGLSQQIESTVKSAFMQFAGIVSQLKTHSLEYARMVGQVTTETYKAEVDIFKTKLEAAVANLRAAVDKNKAQLEAFNAQLDVQVKTKAMEYDRMKLQLAAAEIPYRAELERNLKEADLEMEGLRAAASAAASAAQAMGQVAAAAMSGINGIAHVSEEA